jgi:prepilin-type N-terminal cleavage/methylation domain-containing protein/prepilin-type processing-associated H-X9-DG protein
MRPDPSTARPRRLGRPAMTGIAGFTLIELLVVITITGVLASLLLPSLSRARAAGLRAACVSNLRQVGVAVQMYAHDHEGLIPYGPVAPPFTSPASFYPSTGTPTSLLSLRDGKPVGLGLLLSSYLSSTPRILFCPGADQPLDADGELAKVGARQAQGSYYYRHASVIQLFYTPSGRPEHIQLDALGKNRNGDPIQALAIDTMFLSPPGLESFNVQTRTHHQQRFANILFADGHVGIGPNADGRFTVDLREGDLRAAFSKILEVLERADVQR